MDNRAAGLVFYELLRDSDTTSVVATSTPELRPKGLGLGATRIVKPEEPVCDKDGNALILKKGAYAKIIAGSHKGNYCEVQGLDDEAGRVIVRTSLKGEILTLNEFLIVPVTSQEYSQGAKVLNNAKYEEYKEKSDRKLEAQRKTKDRNIENNSYDDFEKDKISKNEYNKKYQKGSTSSYKMEQSNEYSDNENNISSEDESYRKFKERDKYKNRSGSDDERDKYKDKSESRRSKYRDKYSPTTDSDETYKKSRDRHRDSSHSDSGSRRNKRKDKKSKKDRSKDRSKSRKEKQKDDKKSGRTRDRSPSYDYKSRENSKKHKSKSRHRRRSSSRSSSSDRDHRSRKR